MAWQRKLDELRRQAFGRIIRLEPKAEDEPFTYENAQKRVGAAGGTGPECITGGWQFILSRFLNDDGKIKWVLSAMLHPMGRSSTEDDWEFLGDAVARLGAPDPTPTLMRDDEPNKPVYWIWTEASS